MRKLSFLLFALLLCGSARAQTLTSIATDTFTRSNATTLGSAWNYTGTNGACQIVSNQAKPTVTSAVGDCLWVANDWPNDQAAQATLTTVTAVGTDLAGAVVRGVFAANGNSGYYAGSYNTDTKVHLVRAYGSFTPLASSSGNVAQGDVIKVTATGCNPVTLTVTQNGTQVISFSDSSTSQICAGNPGVYVFSPTSTANAGVTNWSAFAVTTPLATVNTNWPQIPIGQPGSGNVGSLSGSNTNPQALGFYIPQKTEQFFGRLQIVVQASTGTVTSPAWVMECSQDSTSATPSWFQVPALLVPTMAPQLGDLFPIYGSFYDVSGLGGAACKFGLGSTSGTVTGTLPVWVMAG